MDLEVYSIRRYVVKFAEDQSTTQRLNAQVLNIVIYSFFKLVFLLNLGMSDLCRQMNGEGGTLSQLTFDRNIPTQFFAKTSGDFQPQPGSTIFTGGRRIRLAEGLEHGPDFFLWNTDAGV